MRIGLFGGTFDPLHNGHMELARACLRQLELDEIMFLPANRNPLKTRKIETPAKHRLGMVQAALVNEPQMAVSDLEITRGGVSYSIDTLGELQMVRPAEYWFLMGADAIKGLPEWKNPERFLRLCRVGLVLRPPLREADALLRIPEVFRERIDLVKSQPMDISSTDLRGRIARKLNVSPYLPASVLQYIKEHKLYQD